MVENLRLRNINNSTTHIQSTVSARYVSEDEFSSLRSYHWVIVSSTGYLITIRSNPCDAGRVEEVFYCIDGAIESAGLPTIIT